MTEHKYATVLVCVECETDSTEGRGWQAHLTDDDEVAFYCAECAEREFGGDDA
jgi:hypothetical protein